jgi:MFS family permease
MSKVMQDRVVQDKSSGFRDHLWWYLGTGAYWFSTSFKWFVLFLLQPLQVAEVVPGGEKNGAWGMVVAIGAPLAIFGHAIIGGLSDRTRHKLGRRTPYLIVGAVMTVLATLFLGTAHSLLFMVLGYFLVQVGDDIGNGPYSALIPDMVPEQHRGRASGVISLMELFAQVVAVVVGIALGNFLLIYITVAVLTVLCAVVTLITTRERSSVDMPVSTNTAHVLSVKGWLEPFKSQDFRWVWGTRFLVAFGFYLILLYVSNYLKDSVGALVLFGFTLKDVTQASLVNALAISVTGGIGSLVAAKWSDSIGQKKMTVISGWLMTAALIPFALIPNYTVIFLMSLLFGLGYGIYLSTSWAIAADVLPSQEDVGKDMGIWQASITSTQVVAGITGYLVDAGNKLTPGGGYKAVFLLAAVFFFFGAQLITRVKRGK